MGAKKLTKAIWRDWRGYLVGIILVSITPSWCWKTSSVIFEEGESPEEAAEKGGREMGLPVLAATFTTAIVFFPVVFLYGVSRFLFTALAAAVVFALFASYMVAMTVVPLFCARFLKGHGSVAHHGSKSAFARLVNGFNHKYDQMLMHYDMAVGKTLLRPAATVLGILGIFVLSLSLYPLVGVAFFPRTDPGQFMINLKAPAGTRLELTDHYVSRVEKDIREVVPPKDLGMVVANIGVTPGFSSMYTSNSGQHTATVQVSLQEGHRVGSYEYMNRVRRRLAEDLPELNTYFQTGGLVDAVVNLGLPAPIDIQVSGSHQKEAYTIAQDLRRQIQGLKGVSDVLIPQDLDYPALRLDIDREMTSRLGLSSKEVVNNVITALTSNQMIAPSYWVDPKSGNDYMLTVQYPDSQIQSLSDLDSIPLRSPKGTETTQLGAVTNIKRIDSPTEVDHYQLQREIDLYVSPSTEDLGSVASQVDKIIAQTKLPEGVRIHVRGSVEGMRQSFKSFGLGLLLSIVLVYLILMAQFASFVDPLIILLAIPPGITGVLVFLLLTGTTLNVMSLMGVIMMTGIVVSNSILIVDVTRVFRRQGMPIREAVALACRVRLRPVLMTSLATILGMIPMALALEAGSEQYAPLARAIIGGLDCVGGGNGVPGSRGVLADPPQGRTSNRRCRREEARRSCCCCSGRMSLSDGSRCAAQNPPRRTGAGYCSFGAFCAADGAGCRGVGAAKQSADLCGALLALASQQVTREAKSSYYPSGVRKHHGRRCRATAAASRPGGSTIRYSTNASREAWRCRS